MEIKVLTVECEDFVPGEMIDASVDWPTAYLWIDLSVDNRSMRIPAMVVDPFVYGAPVDGVRRVVVWAEHFEGDHHTEDALVDAGFSADEDDLAEMKWEIEEALRPDQRVHQIATRVQARIDALQTEADLYKSQIAEYEGE